jgi:hypothetical protein
MSELIDDHHRRRDLKLAERAIRNGWVIPEGILEALPKIAANLALTGSSREKVAAIRVILAMKEQNDRPDAQVPQTTINVGVSVDNRIDEQRVRTLAIAERIRGGKLL